LAACSAPSRPVPVQNKAATLVDEPLPCDAIDRADIEIERDRMLVLIACDSEPDENHDTWTRSAMLVRRTAGHTTSTFDLGSWSQTRESGSYWGLEGVVRDDARRVRRVVLRHSDYVAGSGGTSTIEVYDPRTGNFTKQQIRGTDLTVTIAPDERSATVTRCVPLSQVIDLTVACKDVPNETTRVPIE
jgi:hypothetical protein